MNREALKKTIKLFSFQQARLHQSGPVHRFGPLIFHTRLNFKHRTLSSGICLLSRHINRCSNLKRLFGPRLWIQSATMAPVRTTGTIVATAVAISISMAVLSYFWSETNLPLPKRKNQKFRTGLTDAIGNAPLIRIDSLSEVTGCEVHKSNLLFQFSFDFIIWVFFNFYCC